MCGRAELYINDHISYHEALLHISRCSIELSGLSPMDDPGREELSSSSPILLLRESLETEGGKLRKCCMVVSLPSVLEGSSPVAVGKVQSDQSLVVECTL